MGESFVFCFSFWRAAWLGWSGLVWAGLGWAGGHSAGNTKIQGGRSRYNLVVLVTPHAKCSHGIPDHHSHRFWYGEVVSRMPSICDPLWFQDTTRSNMIWSDRNACQFGFGACLFSMTKHTNLVLVIASATTLTLALCSETIREGGRPRKDMDRSCRIIEELFSTLDISSQFKSTLAGNQLRIAAAFWLDVVFVSACLS